MHLLAFATPQNRSNRYCPTYCVFSLSQYFFPSDENLKQEAKHHAFLHRDFRLSVHPLRALRQGTDTQPAAGGKRVPSSEPPHIAYESQWILWLDAFPHYYVL